MIAKLAFQLILAIIPIYVLIESSGYVVESFDTSGGPGVFPRGIAWFMLALTAIQMVRTVVRGVKSSRGELEENPKLDAPVVFWSLFWGVPGIILLASIVYALLIPLTGFMLASSLFLIFAGAFLMYKADGQIARKSIILRAVVFIIFSVAIYQLFRRGMRIYLPTGILGF